MIWIIGGTRLAIAAATALDSSGYSVLVTTATEYGKTQVPLPIPSLALALNQEEMMRLISHHAIRLIIDASHPYAEEVSWNALAVSRATGVPYIRLERRELPRTDQTVNFKTYPEIVRYLLSTTGNILLTTGSRNLPFFAELDKKRLFVRLLPVVESIQKAQALGFITKQIIAVQGPCSLNLNRAILKEYAIRFMVTKQSGSEGGESEKTQAAMAEQVTIVTLLRPTLPYPVIVYDPEALLTLTGGILNNRN